MERDFTLSALEPTRCLSRLTRLAGWTLAAFLCTFSVHSLPGDYDVTYSGDGKATALWGMVNAGDFSPISTTASVLTADQKLVVASKCRQVTGVGFCVGRFNPDGTRDNSFGLAFGPSSVNINLHNVTGLAIDPRNQALVAVGECLPPGAPYRTFCVARFTQNGAFDAVSSGAGASALAHVKVGRVRVAKDGKIRVGGGCPDGPAATNMDMCVVALNADFSWDTTFTRNGSSRLVIPQIGDARAESVADIEFLADGRLFFVGPCKHGSDIWVCYGSVNPDGTQAPSRDKFFVSLFDDYPTQVLRTSSGALLIAGYSTQSNRPSPNYFNDRQILARINYLPTGTSSLDTTFNATAMRPGVLMSDAVSGSLHSGSLSFALSATQEIYATAVTHSSFDSALGPFSARVTVRHSDGALRATWGGTANADYSPTYENVLLDDAGRVLLSGRSNYLDTSGTIHIGRLQNGALAGSACTMDIDGDGKVSATTDGVLLARAMLGLKGTALTQNAIGVGAVRTDPDAIRAYLVNRCKMPLN